MTRTAFLQQNSIQTRPKAKSCIAKAQSQISDQILGIAPKTLFVKVKGRLPPVGEQMSHPPNHFRRGETEIEGSKKVKNEVEREATKGQAFNEGRDGIAEIQELESAVQIVGKRVIGIG
jgi:hypothetical protein